ncbi:Solute carrier organic anion transporter family member 1B3 [Vulpes lagopus]|uniref:solute carrier organic anion transporter family member 1B3 isoform X1 n=1 Tax=Vulpes lagopus TaxID=494514 RepID=UPI001BCA4962|nr:solute carrier organic anion transporter family member 1B3 isoform X1 [Vulpes lagopus]XP_041591732.1 solute carrier organic anion transporter family member 1B3 isoform X1 [Vulpes lagopus]XP_041591733.1 solute carrier organic anion transporter family member 1B3 isoform X1 [Vulpes lagopus]XP_041591734.1 solute carrier organic anion transporter family member 1B3 isoform X1 [Vulpes lagopus]XP_041591735.1 solute carrier organic anion transporter family member 1B3 isoform X1 [Vulpes lagopus]
MMDSNQQLKKTAEVTPPKERETKCCNGFKMFLVALSFSFTCKALGGVVMKSSITQIERRFDISSSISGLIDGGFEIGNLLVIVFVSYFGSKLHRPKIIGIGCFIMGTGSILTALPHFFMGYYRYSKETHINPSENLTSSFPTCLLGQNLLLNRTSSEIVEKGCEKESVSYIWLYVLLGNMLRGIGETPIVPLGISYIDDFAEEGHSSFYLGTLHAISMIGPIIGFIQGSVFAKMYVDIGYVDLSDIRITPKDTRWVGAWWLGFLVAGILSIMSSIPFFFLPRDLNKPQQEEKNLTSLHLLKTNEERSQMTNVTNHGQSLSGNITGFFQSLKSILTNPLYVILQFLTLLLASSHIGAITYIFKYVEQQYGQSASEANIWLGTITLPTVATGIFVGGYVIKKFKLTLLGIAKLSFCTSLLSFLFQLLTFALICESKPVAGLTLTYDGNNPVTSPINVPLSYCNSNCNCDENDWEPVCGDSGITYMSPCLAGCKSSSGSKMSMVFHNCSCVEVTGVQNKNNSVHLGECPRDSQCRKKFYIYALVQVLNYFFSSLGSTPTIMLVFKNVQPELKSLAVGFHSLTIRALGGIPAPIYFGALIDRACMKWSTSSCGKPGFCRMYNSTLYGNTYLSLIESLKFASLTLHAVLIITMKKIYQGKDTKASENGRKDTNEANLESLNNDGYFVPSAREDNETHM